MRICLIILSLFVLIPGCEKSTSPVYNSILVIQTNHSQYFPDSTTIITLSVKNISGNPVYYICTGQIYLDEYDENCQINSWMVHGFEECLTAVAIEPDSLKTFDFSFNEDSGLGRILDASFTDSVIYRFRIDVFYDTDFEHLLDKKNRVSNFFEIKSP